MKTNSDIITDKRIGFFVAITVVVILFMNEPLVSRSTDALVKTAIPATMFSP